MVRVHSPEDLEAGGRELQLGITIDDGIPLPVTCARTAGREKIFAHHRGTPSDSATSRLNLLPTVRQMLKIRQSLIISPKFFQ